jgi:hypothetical protein
MGAYLELVTSGIPQSSGRLVGRGFAYHGEPSARPVQ